MVTIEQNSVKNIIVNKDDKSFVVPSGTSIKKFFDGGVAVGIVFINDAYIHKDIVKAIDVSTVTDINGNVTTINGDALLLYQTLVDTFFFRPVTRWIDIIGDPGNNTGLTELIEFYADQKIDWKGVWKTTTPETLYQLYDQVYDEGWLMIANKITSDKAAPQAIGDSDLFIENATFGIQSNSSVIYSGHRYEFLKPGWVGLIKVFISEISVDTKYRIIVIDETDTNNVIVSIINEPVLVVGEWVNVAVGNTIVQTGSKFRILLDSINSGSNTIITGGWTYIDDKANDVPLVGEWYRSKHDSLRINYIDLDSVDRTSELQGITIESTIQFIQTNDTEKGWIYLVIDPPVDMGTYILFPSVTRTVNIGNIGKGQNTTATITIPIPQPTQYVQDVDYLLNNPGYAIIEGYLAFDGVEQIGFENNAFGIDIEFQEAEVSDDWDFASNSSEIGQINSEGIAGIEGLISEALLYSYLDSRDFNRLNQTTEGLINNSNQLETYLSLKYATPILGLYKISTSFEWSHDAANNNFISEVDVIDQNNNVLFKLYDQVEEPKDSGGSGVDLDVLSNGLIDGDDNSGTDQRYLTSFSRIVKLNKGQNVFIRLRWRPSNNNVESAIYNGNISIEFKHR